MPVINRLTQRQQAYSKFRGAGLNPKDAYRSAGFSMKTGAIYRQIARLEEEPRVIAAIKRFEAKDKRTPEEIEAARIEAERKAKAEAFQAELDQVKAEAKVTIPKAKDIFASKKAGKLNKDEIERRLITLAERAEEMKDLGTARQCYEALGKNQGMFTPVQKIRIETVEDLSLEETDALIQKLMAVKRQESAPQLEDDAGATELVQ